jgi:hypothetical protein
MDVEGTMDDIAARAIRKKPGTGSSIPPAEVALRPSRLRLVAPAFTSTKNTIRFVTWVEVRLVNDRGMPIANEKALLYRGDGEVVDATTDRNGVARFDNLPLLFDDLSVRREDMERPAVFFPNILEEHEDAPPGEFGKNRGERSDYRKHDGIVHFVPAETSNVEVVVNTLTEEEKFQHFRHAYEDNGAQYADSHPGLYSSQEKRWNWGKGAVCNQHVNFFLGYWFNYCESFTAAGSATVMTCLPLYSSTVHSFAGGIRHRGFLEFLRPVTGFGSALGVCYDPDNPTEVPDPAHFSTAYKSVEYIRMCKYFDRETCEPNENGRALVNALGDFNVYSLSDIRTPQRPRALTATRAWLRKNKAALRLTDHAIAAMTEAQLWDFIWDLDDSDEGEAELINTLKSQVNWDHHAGILLKRASGGGPRTGAEGEEVELWTFSADSGSTTPGPLIRMKTLAGALKGSKFQMLAIWKLKALRPGGFAPAVTNEGSIDVDAPPRFVHWG